MIDEHQLLATVEAEIASIAYPAIAPKLFRPIAYTLQAGGKRLRPLLTLAVCQAVCGDASRAINQAVGLEMFHNFTLIHDDVMDRSPMRRGRNTVYRKWGDVQAILSGDALLTMATQRVVLGADDKAGRVLDLFNRTALEIYEGQQLDIEFESRERVTVKQYMEMIRLKTSVLLGAACAMGAIMGGADEDTTGAYYRYGEALGLAFQLRDDWLDVFGEQDMLGKSIGTDILDRKKTWLLISLTKTIGRSAVEDVYSRVAGKRLISEIKRLYEKYSLSEKCMVLIEKYAAQAVESLPEGMNSEAREWLAGLASKLSTRRQ